MNDYFKNDEYWKEHINKELEIDTWINDYMNYIPNIGNCLDLGCGVGQYSKILMSYGLNVISADISDIALNEVSKFNSNTKKVDMSENYHLMIMNLMLFLLVYQYIILMKPLQSD